MPEKMAPGHGPFEQAIRIAYRPSRTVFIVLAVLHMLALCSLMLVEIPVWVGLLLAALVVVGLFKSCVDYRAQREHYPHRELLLDTNELWYLIDNREAAVELRLRPAALVHPLLIALRFSDARRRKYVFILTRDNVDKDTLRRLRVRLCFADGAKESLS